MRLVGCLVSCLVGRLVGAIVCEDTGQQCFTLFLALVFDVFEPVCSFVGELNSEIERMEQLIAHAKVRATRATRTTRDFGPFGLRTKSSAPGYVDPLWVDLFLTLLVLN